MDTGRKPEAWSHPWHLLASAAGNLGDLARQPRGAMRLVAVFPPPLWPALARTRISRPWRGCPNCDWVASNRLSTTPKRLAAKIVQAMSTPFIIEKQAIDVTTSIGLTFYQGDATTVEALVRKADVMLYQAKGAGRNNVQVALRLIEGGRA